MVINYDQNGNLIDEVLSQYQWTIFEAEWDYNNRMITSGGWSAETLYLYDHSGQRILKDTGDEYSGITSIYANQYYNERTNKETSELTKTLNVYDNKGNLVATAEEAGETNNLYYVNGDHLGSSSVMTTDEGEQEQVVDYFPFGNMRFNERSDAENWSFDEKKKFTGHEYDADAAGLTYMGARYYSGEAGKFISQDPLFWIVGDKDYNDMWREKLFSPQSLNSYSYGLNNPMIYLDPTGLDSDVFYTKPFSSQASAEQSRLSSAYGEPVYMHEVSTVNQFTSAWNGMGKNGSDIDEVTILSHSDANNIYLNGDKEKLTTTPNMFNVDPKTLGTSIDSLSKKDIGQINLYTCEGGNISHATNLAKAFATSQQTTVMGFDGRLSFVPFLGSPMFSLRGQLKHYNEYGRAPLGWVTYSKNGSYSVGNDSQRPPYIYKWIGYFAGFNN